MSLSAEAVSFNTNRATLLNRVSITVASGELVALLGANGAGKSTLLRVLSAELRPTGGRVSLDGRDLKSFRPLELAKRRAVLPQDSALEFPFSALEVALMGRAPHVRTSETPHDYRIARAALHSTNASAFETRSYPSLSGGERQRVQLARVMAQIWERGPASRFLLLDEPTSSLDVQHQHDTLRVAQRLAGEGVGVLAILHDLNLAALYADRVVILQRGEVLACGSPQALLEPKLIHEAFGLNVAVIPHPTLPRPLIVAIPS